IEVGGLVMVAGAGLAAPPAAGWADLPPLGTALPGLAGAALLAFFAYLGFEDMVNMAEETIAPERTMPRAILIALAVTALIYMLVALAAVRAVPVAQLAGSERPLALVMAAGWPAGVALLSAIAVVAALNGVLAQIVMAARVLYGLGARHGGPAVLARVDPRRGTPVVATLGVGALVLVLALAVPLEALAEATSALLLAVFMAVNGSLIALRRQPAPARGMFRAPSWAPWAGLVLSALTLGLGMV
ncbi:MAG: amino acid permease, partial [Alphaproteobacteria bacterium]